MISSSVEFSPRKSVSFLARGSQRRKDAALHVAREIRAIAHALPGEHGMCVTIAPDSNGNRSLHISCYAITCDRKPDADVLIRAALELTRKKLVSPDDAIRVLRGFLRQETTPDMERHARAERPSPIRQMAASMLSPKNIG